MKLSCYYPIADRPCETEEDTDRHKSELGLSPKGPRTAPAFFSITFSPSLYRTLDLSVGQVTSFINFELKTDPPSGMNTGPRFSSETLAGEDPPTAGGEDVRSPQHSARHPDRTLNKDLSFSLFAFAREENVEFCGLRLRTPSFASPKAFHSFWVSDK